MGAKNVEDVYPLSPMQEGLLFHSLYAQDHAVYVTHITCTLENLDVPAFERAWQQVMDRHPALRTAFAATAPATAEAALPPCPADNGSSLFTVSATPDARAAIPPPNA